MITRTYKYRLYLTKTQETLFNSQLSSCRWLYNHFLEERRNAYKKDKKRISCFDQIKEIPKLKKENPELSKIYSQVLQDVARRVDKSFQNFFRRVYKNKRGRKQKPGYPRFKGKYRYNSFVYPQSGFELRINQNKPKHSRMYLSKIGTIKLRYHRPIEKLTKIKTCTIIRKIDKWYACFTVEINKEVKEKKKIEDIMIKNMVGIDVGLNNLLATSKKEIIDNPRYLRKSEEKLSRIQRKHSRKKLKSKNRSRSRLKVARIHEKIANQRLDLFHKLSNKLVNNFQFIAFENLNIKGMVKNKYLAKSISDVSWKRFLSMLVYKAEEAGRWAVGVNPRNTSQICSNCSKIVSKTLAVRIHKCPKCGLIIDRDINAARNILKLALSTVGTTGINACGVEGLLSTMKQEALRLQV